MATVIVPSLLRDLSSGQNEIIVDGRTLRQVIENLDAAYPGVKARLLENGMIRDAISIAINGDVIVGGLSEQVPDGAEIAIMPAISGGAIR